MTVIRQTLARVAYTVWAKKVIPLVQCNIICTRGITFLAHPVVARADSLVQQNARRANAGLCHASSV